MKKSDASAPPVETSELVFPDWSGMDDSSARISADAAFLLCEQHRAWFPLAAERWLARRPEPCSVEFVL